MAFNGSGVFERLYNWVTDKGNAVKITASRVDAETDGIVAGLNQVIDGTQGFIGAVRGTNGTASAPAFSFTDDTNTGVYRIGADNLGFSVNGTLEASVEAGYFDATNGLKIGGTAVTSTAAELNILDGVTATAAELNILDGVTATATELNLLAGETSLGALVYLGQTDLSSSTSLAVDMSTYETVFVSVENVVFGTDAVDARLSVSDDSEASYEGGGYMYAHEAIGATASTSNSGAFILVGSVVGNDTNEGLSACFWISHRTGRPTTVTGQSNYENFGGNIRIGPFGGRVTSTTAPITHIKLEPSSGSVTSGTMKAWALRDS